MWCLTLFCAALLAQPVCSVRVKIEDILNLTSELEETIQDAEISEDSVSSEMDVSVQDASKVQAILEDLKQALRDSDSNASEVDGVAKEEQVTDATATGTGCSDDGEIQVGPRTQKSWKCLATGTVGWETLEECKKHCGGATSELQVSSAQLQRSLGSCCAHDCCKGNKYQQFDPSHGPSQKSQIKLMLQDLDQNEHPMCTKDDDTCEEANKLDEAKCSSVCDVDDASLMEVASAQNIQTRGETTNGSEENSEDEHSSESGESVQGKTTKAVCKALDEFLKNNQHFVGYKRKEFRMTPFNGVKEPEYKQHGETEKGEFGVGDDSESWTLGGSCTWEDSKWSKTIFSGSPNLNIFIRASDGSKVLDLPGLKKITLDKSQKEAPDQDFWIDDARTKMASGGTWDNKLAKKMFPKWHDKSKRDKRLAKMTRDWLYPSLLIEGLFVKNPGTVATFKVTYIREDKTTCFGTPQCVDKWYQNSVCFPQCRDLEDMLAEIHGAGDAK